MAAAYAALVSLRHIIEHTVHHPHPPISLDKSQIQSLIDKITSLQEFLEGYSTNGRSKEADHHHVLESHIADVAYAAEDIIESHIVDQIQAHGENMSSIDLYQGVKKVIQEMDLIMKEVMEIKEKTISEQQMNYSMSAGPSSSSPMAGQNATMVGLDDVLIEVMDKLTGQQSNRQIIPIVGMGGIGKTTLARNVYLNPLTVHHFDILGWATISQEYNAKEILLQILLCLKTTQSGGSLSQMSENELGEILHKSLSGRRYLIVLDDIWSIEAWDIVKFFLPDNNNNNGSRIIITTRISNLAFQLSGFAVFWMNFLDDTKSWDLLCKSVFGEEGCPIELEDIGKEIAKNCKGLPLSIVVIGGHLAKSTRTRQHWEYIAENLSSIIHLEDNERCLKILALSYNQLPVHLKPCFLYMGVFQEDSMIRASHLIRLWVAEGFVKPIIGKTLEEAGKEYLNDLIGRNLILVRMLGSTGNVKFCTIHDLVRDLCLKEAEKDKFFGVAKIHSPNTPQISHTLRRVAIQKSTSKEEYFPQVVAVVQSVSLTRSLICNIKVFEPALPFRLLRVLNAVDKHDYFEMEKCGAYSLEDIFQLVNLRHLNVVVESNFIITSLVYHLWNLQTLVVHRWIGEMSFPIFDIWKMPQLRHVKIDQLTLPYSPSGDVILWNLQTLKIVLDFKCGEEEVKRIPNIKKLGIEYAYAGDLSGYGLNNLCRLRKLESLTISILSVKFKSSQSSLSFPHFLKKLTLTTPHLHWEDMDRMVDPLPHLQVLKLYSMGFAGPEWETVQGHFQSLKFLLICDCYNLEKWTTDSTHFPRLEHLVLRRLYELEEIPSDIGEITTLKLIELDYCSRSVVVSAKAMLDEQEELGNECLQVRVQLWKKNEALESLASRQFQVKIH